MKTDLFISGEEEEQELDALALSIRKAWISNGCRPASLEKIRADLERPCYRDAISLFLYGV